MFRLIVPASCTVEINGAVQISANCLDGEVELVIELAVPTKPEVPASYWQDTETDPVEDEPFRDRHRLVPLGTPIPNPPSRRRDPEDETVV